MKILLVEPNFPFPNKSKNKASQTHKNFLPIALLKFAALHKAKGDKVRLVRGNLERSEIGFIPDEILVTSLFTYWSKYVWDAISRYRLLFPRTVIKLGGIYATLHSEQPEFQAQVRKYNVRVMRGISPQAEQYLPDYTLLSDTDYHATHMMRGCIRRCSFCGTWKLEPGRVNKSKDDMVRELKQVGKNKIIFYDNNILANPDIKEILQELSTLRINGKPMIFESQSGFDGRLLTQDIADLIKKAHFRNPRIAWDNSYSDYKQIERQIHMLRQAGYSSKDIYVFMIYNYINDFNELGKKRRKCWEWKVQVADCRYRPLTQTFDNFNARRLQTGADYYIHEPIWTDTQIKQFRKNVRRQNICIRHNFLFYSRLLENMMVGKKKSLELRRMSRERVLALLPDAWFPDENMRIGKIDFRDYDTTKPLEEAALV